MSDQIESKDDIISRLEKENAELRRVADALANHIRSFGCGNTDPVQVVSKSFEVMSDYAKTVKKLKESK